MHYALGQQRVEFRGKDYYIAPNATVIGSVIVENEVSIWFNTVIRGDNDVITLGERSNVQDGSVLHTDPGYKLTLGRDVSVGHMVMLHGCTIGDNTLVGINSVTLNDAVIGENCLIGANTLIPEGKTIPPGSLVLGSPARVKRELNDEEIAGLREIAQHYVDKIKRYKGELGLG
ncbi:MAG: gamma carbonic anhydrase family protein [Acidiferrobacterales bacterium]